MIDTILNTYCEVEFFCKNNSPNWIGPFIILTISLIISFLDMISLTTEKKTFDERSIILQNVVVVISIFILCLFIGWIL